VDPQSWITPSPPAEALCPQTSRPGLLAYVAVRRVDEHLPYNRLENVYDREGMRLGRSTLYGWLDALRELFAPPPRAPTSKQRSAQRVPVRPEHLKVQGGEGAAARSVAAAARLAPTARVHLRIAPQERRARARRRAAPGPTPPAEP